METARTLMHNANLNFKFWVEAISTSNYLQNLTPIKAIEDIPWKIWFNNQPEYKHLRVFGCAAYAQLPNEKRKKLDMKVENAYSLVMIIIQKVINYTMVKMMKSL
jgi:hypothetical protein